MTKPIWTYTGDVNLEHGGMWLDLETYKQDKDHCPCVKVTDLDGAIGFEGAIMIERGSIYLGDKYRKYALGCCGYTEEDVKDNPVLLIEAYDAYMGIDGPEMFTIQTKDDGAMEFYGWKADLKLSDLKYPSGYELRAIIYEEYVI